MDCVTLDQLDFFIQNLERKGITVKSKKPYVHKEVFDSTTPALTQIFRKPEAIQKNMFIGMLMFNWAVLPASGTMQFEIATDEQLEPVAANQSIDFKIDIDSPQRVFDLIELSELELISNDIVDDVLPAVGLFQFVGWEITY